MGFEFSKDQKATFMGRLRKRVMDIVFKLVVLAPCLKSHVDFRAAIWAFHQIDPASGLKTVDDVSKGVAGVFDSPSDDSLDWVKKFKIDVSSDDGEVFQFQRLAHAFQELHSLLHAFGENYGLIRIFNFERNTGKTGSCAHV